MRKILNVISVECKKTIMTHRFLYIVVALTFMFLCVPILKDDGTLINCVGLLFIIPQEELSTSYMFEFSRLISSVISGYFELIAPMIVSMAVLPILCEEKESGMFRYVISRSGKNATTIGSFIATIIVGGTILLVGYIFFATIMGIYYYIVMGGNGIAMKYESVKLLMLNILGLFINGIICAIWTYFTSIFVKNRYLLTCIPYIALYLINRLLNAISYEYVLDKYMLRYFVKTFALSYLYVNFQSTIHIIWNYIIIAGAIIVLHIHVQRGRLDCGQ